MFRFPDAQSGVEEGECADELAAGGRIGEAGFSIPPNGAPASRATRAVLFRAIARCFQLNFHSTPFNPFAATPKRICRVQWMEPNIGEEVSR